MKTCVKTFFDTSTSTFSHVVYAEKGSACAVIDSVLGYDARSGKINTQAAESIMDFVKSEQLSVQWLLETHAHADHLSAASYLKEKLGGCIAISKEIKQVQNTFKSIYNLKDNFFIDNHGFDYLFEPDETFYIGHLKAVALHVPGHTPADIAYYVEDVVFVGDTLFPHDVGTARCDFPGGNAAQLFRSIQRILTLPEKTRLYLCHDYPPQGRDEIYECSIAEQRANNIHVRDGISETEFIAMRLNRDSQLNIPDLLLPSMQVNIRAGQLPSLEGNGMRYLKIPINAF